MSKTVKLLCAGILPLPVGWIFNYILLYLSFSGILLNIIELALFAAWGYLAYQISDAKKNPIVQAVLLSAFGALMLALNLYQELCMGQYWGNLIGAGTQMFFLPFLTITLSVAMRFMEFTRVWPAYVFTWIALFLTGCIGCCIKRRR